MPGGSVAGSGVDRVKPIVWDASVVETVRLCAATWRARAWGWLALEPSGTWTVPRLPSASSERMMSAWDCGVISTADTCWLRNWARNAAAAELPSGVNATISARATAAARLPAATRQGVDTLAMNA